VTQTWQETELETLQAAIEELKQEVTALEGLTDPADLDATLRQLERDGFGLKTSVDFEAGRCEPENCWRRPFFLQEIRKKYAVEREVPPVKDLEVTDLATDGGRENVAAALTADLRDGTQRVVIGAPGSGKSTILKTVANRWEQCDETGPILYRETGTARAIETATDFIESVETLAGQDDPVLVIVEDAAREATLPVFEAIHKHIDDGRVSYLLDSREHEWDRDRFRDLVRRHEAIDLDAEKGKRVVASFGDHIDDVYAPPLDEREVERIIERFEAETEYSVPQEPAELFDHIQSHRGASSMLLLVYSLPVAGFQPESDEDVSMLEENVREIYTAVTDPVAAKRTLINDPEAADTDLFEQLGLAIVLSNAMEIGVRRELLLTLAEDDSERQEIDEFLEALDGALVFGCDGNRYWSHHELWSYLYLEQHLKSSVQPAIPRQSFEDCANALLSICGADVRTALTGYLGGNSDLIDLIKMNESGFADTFVRDLFSVGTSRASLAPLFGTSEHSGIELPQNCSLARRAECASDRAMMWRLQGKLSKAVTEYTEAYNRDAETDQDPMEVDAQYFLRLGHIAFEKDDVARIERFNRRSLRLYRELGDESGEATSLNNLGIVAKNQGEGDYEQARKYHEQSLEIRREIGDRAGVATSLNNLGTVAKQQDNYKTALEHYDDALVVFAEIGAQTRELQTYKNLVRAARDADRPDEAVNWCEQGLRRCAEIDLPVANETEETLQELRASIESSPERTRELYQFALGAVLNNKAVKALSHLQTIWERRDQYTPEDDIYPLILAAGVGAAAHLSTPRSDDNETDITKILDTIEPHANSLRPPVATLYEFLRTGEAPLSPEEVNETDDGEIDPEGLLDLEALAYARLLEALDSE